LSFFSFRRAGIAASLSVSLAACGGGGSSSLPSGGGGGGGGNNGPLLSRIVGVGDSLTAGEQSDALLGQTISPNPLGSGSPFPVVPNTQGNGYYALIWSQANGGANPLNIANSPLPLMAPPGLGSILLPTTSGGLTSIVAPCQGPAAIATTYSSALQTRLNPTTTPFDVAVPGQTLREAIVMKAPAAPCDGGGLPPQELLLNGIIQPEDVNLWPVLGNFPQGTTQLAAAVSLKPTLALVWLGSNDLLKYAFSNGAFPPTTQTQFQSDTINVIKSMQKAGAKVAVSNLVDVLDAAVFTKVGNLPGIFAQALGPYGVTPSEAAALAATVQAYLASTYGLGNNGYLLLSGTAKIQGAVIFSLENDVPLIQALQAQSAQLVAGDYFVDSVAATVQKNNDLYNAAIAAAAKQTGAALVDTHALVAQIAANNGYYPLPSNPKCCFLYYGGGFFSLDGIHPSNTGYALLANNWIATIDGAYNAGIPPLSASQIATINANDLYSPH
jgi:lysophospholipase L1-like esterase